MTDDAELLRRYAESHSEAAFAELVQRRIGLVYSVALRQTRDAHRANDVVQAVFTDLARKAALLSRRPVLAGWLYRSAQFAAADIVRAEQRRARREQEAQIMQNLFADGSDLAWEKVRPILDDALNDLNEPDRDAVLLRFFDDRSFADIGAQLKLTENAARMRVERALDKLHAALSRRGVTSTAATLGIALAGQASLAAPAGLAATVTGVALTGAAAAGGGTAILSSMALSKLQMGIAAAVVAVGVGSIVVYQRENAAQHRVAAETESKTPAAPTATAPRASTPLAAPAAPALFATRAFTPEVAAGQQATPSPRPVASAKSDQIQRWLADADQPVVLRALAAEARKLTENRFGDLFIELDLGPERTEAFARLLDEQRQAPRDVAVASYKNGIDPRNDMEAFEAAVVTTREKIDGEIRAALGESAYAHYIAFNQSQVVVDTFIRLGRVLTGTPDDLTPQQTAQLRTLLKSDGSDGILSAQKITAARAFLSSPQIEALEGALAQQRSTKAGRFRDALPPPPEKP